MPKANKKQVVDENKKASRSSKEKDSKEKDSPSGPIKSIRTRRFSLVTYIEPNWLQSFLQSSKWVQHWAYCTHDRDLWTADDEKKNTDHVAGTLKDKHTHIVLYTYDAKTAIAVKKNFDNFSKEYYSHIGEEPQNTLTQECSSMVVQWRYLRHIDNDDKVHYDVNEVVCDDYSYWNTLEDTDGLTDVKNTGMAILSDLMSGTDSLTMCQRYGKEYIYHFNHYKTMVNQILVEEYRPTFEGLRDLCELALADSPYSNERIVMFLNMLSYVQSKFNDCQNSYVIEKQLKA